jgi:uncharacterized protein (UPF0332 family)
MTDIAPRQWIENAHRRLDDARFLLRDGRSRTATPQVYFALYYACRGLLEAEGFYFERHASITSNVGRVQRYRERLNASFPTAMQYRRERCDYDLFIPEADDVRLWIDAAERFITGADDLLTSPN